MSGDVGESPEIGREDDVALVRGGFLHLGNEAYVDPLSVVAVHRDIGCARVELIGGNSVLVSGEGGTVQSVAERIAAARVALLG